MRMPLFKEKIIQQLRAEISQKVSDVLVKITSERLLAEQLGVSRVTVRAAIKTLVDEGLLVQIQGKGTYIIPQRKKTSLDILCSPEIKQIDPYYSNFFMEVSNIASRQSVDLFLVNLDQIKNAPRSEALMIVGLIDNEQIAELSKVYKNIIGIGDYFDNSNISQVCFDNYNIGYQAANLLAEYNYRNIFHLAGPKTFYSAFNREKGFVETLGNLEIPVITYNSKMNWSGGYAAGDEIAEKVSVSHSPAAVFAANDWMAIGLIQKLKEKGVKVPQDISVVGCDDIPLASDYCPSLTTFRLDAKYLIAEAFSVINTAQTDSLNGRKRVLLTASLVERDSLVSA